MNNYYPDGMSLANLIHVGEINDPMDACEYLQEYGVHDWGCMSCEQAIVKRQEWRHSDCITTKISICKKCHFTEDGLYEGPGDEEF